MSKSEEKRPRSSLKSDLTPMQLKIPDVFKRKSKGRKELTRSKQRSLLLIRRMSKLIGLGRSLKRKKTAKSLQK